MKKMMMAAPALMLCMTSMAQLPEAVQPYENAIQVNGTAEREIVPDEIYIKIVISENDTKGKTSVDAMEQQMIKVLQAAGINVEEDLRVGDMSASMYSKTFGGRSARTTATYQLKVGSASMMAKIYQDLAAAGIYNLSVIRVSHSRLREFNDELRMEAVRNAQATARAMAEALGQDIGRAVYIVDYNQQPMYARSAVLMDSAGAAPYDQPEIEFRNIKLNYSVTVKFALQ